MPNNLFGAARPYVISLSLAALLVLLADPFHWMPPMGAMIALLAAAILLILFAGFVMHERGGDERDALHRLTAGRISYLSGIGVLTAALIAQGLSHAIDPWILLALGVMVLAKVAAHFYATRYR